MKVAVIDYGVGNLGSLLTALDLLGVTPSLVNRASDLHFNDGFILPGVGDFSNCMRLLTKLGWVNVLEEEVLGLGKPLLGVCVGMQLLASFGMEGTTEEANVGVEGLGLVPGEVHNLRTLGCKKRVPHVGWNEVNCLTEAGILNGIPTGTDFYFVHSYAFVPDTPETVVATTDYGIPVTAVIHKDNIWGTQFHPEKSSKAGLKLLQNFVDSNLC